MRLYETLINYKNLNRISFHTPGHKNNCRALEQLFALDYTELDDTDSLFEASGPILKSEEYAAKIFGAQRSLLSAGGCTLCIQAMLKLVASSGGNVICSRVIHKSAINTMALLNLNPIFINQTQDLETSFLKPITPSDVENALKSAAEKVAAVYLTSPDYFGVISDIEGISKICKKYKVPLLVDNAHGAHLGFLPANQHPIHLGADLCSDSLHKTLPVLTGGALLHINNEEFVKSAKSAMALFGSTSPSYPIMASLDLCLEWIKKEAKSAYEKLIKKLEPIKSLIKEKGILSPIGKVDPTRISLNIKSAGLTGVECATHLKKHGIEPELYTDDFVVLIATPFNKDEDFLSLEEALRDLEVGTSKSLSKVFKGEHCCYKMSLNEAILSKSEVVSTHNAKNKICAETVCQCPPGIPILIPGELITSQHIDFLLDCGILFLEVIK